MVYFVWNGFLDKLGDCEICEKDIKVGVDGVGGGLEFLLYGIKGG